MKSAACIKLLYITIGRNKGLIDSIFQLQNGTISIHDVQMMIYYTMRNATNEWIQGKRTLSATWLYKDLTILKEYMIWIAHCVWYPFTHSASDSTRATVLWLNNKTHIIATLHEAFMELPGIKRVRDVVKSVEHTIDHRVIQPIHQKITQIIRGITNRVSYYSNAFIHWVKPMKIAKDSINAKVYNVSK
jgi:hypothetical protein